MKRILWLYQPLRILIDTAYGSPVHEDHDEKCGKIVTEEHTPELAVRYAHKSPRTAALIDPDQALAVLRCGFIRSRMIWCRVSFVSCITAPVVDISRPVDKREKQEDPQTDITNTSINPVLFLSTSCLGTRMDKAPVIRMKRCIKWSLSHELYSM
jgi:hypothetical protein